VETIERAYELAKEAGDMGVLLRVYNNLPSIVSVFGSDHRRAIDVLHEGIELAERAGAVGYLAWFMGTLSDATTELGLLEETEATERESIALAERAGDEPLRGIRLNQLAWVVFLRGRLDEAVALQAQAVPILEDNREPQAEVLVYETEAAIALAQGRDGDALERLRKGVELARGFTLDQAPMLFYELVQLLLRNGDRAEADGYRDLSAPGRAPAASAFGLAIEGLLEEDALRAVERLQRSVDAFDGLGMRLAQARVLVDLGHALERAGRDPRPAFERARDLFTACDARIYLPEVEALLAEARR
jgi:tetratricopeptide (TPR) repeat protein